MLKLKYFLFLLGIGLSAQSNAQFEYPKDMLPALGECRDCLFINPDSCQTLMKDLFLEADQRKLYHIPAKIALLKGISHTYRNELTKGIETFRKAEKMALQLEPSDILVDARNNIGNIYISQGDSALAIKYFKLGLAASEEMNDIRLVLSTKIQIASLSISEANAPETIDLMNEIAAQIDSVDQGMQAYFYLIKGDMLYEQGEYDSSLYNAKLSYKYYAEKDDKIGIVSSNNDIGSNYIKLNQPEKAITYCLAGLSIAEEEDFGLWKSQNCECLWQAHKALGNSEKALYYHEKMVSYLNDAKNDDRIRELTAHEVESEYEKIIFADSLKAIQESELLAKETEIQVHRAEKKMHLLIIGFVALLIFIALLIMQMRNRKKANEVITAQKNILESRQTEILDSIQYAQRLQNAILPSPSQLSGFGKEAFVLFRPKDVVSGDFYWMYEKEFKSGEKIKYMAVGDCTGHGVPGAMVSVVCSNALEHAVKKLKEPNTGLLLDHVNKMVQRTFETEANNISDGMDICLVGYNENTNEIQYSGAHNSLFLVKQNKELHEIKGARQPIGRFVHTKPFEVNRLTLETGDIVYLSTDGYQDQFGGDNVDATKSGKKFKKKTLKELFVTVSSKPLHEQETEFIQIHEKWKGDFEQTDDICLLAIQF